MKDLLLLHGAIGSAAQIAPLKALLEPQLRVHTLDFPGHGGTGMPAEFSIPAFARFVAEFLDEQQLENVSVFGYSMGGYVAMYIARNYGKPYFSRIITLGTKYHWDEPVAEKETRMLRAEVIEQKVPAFAEVLKERHSPNDWKAVLSMTAEMLLEMSRNSPLREEDFSHIYLPVVVMLGDGDKMVTLDESTTVANMLPAGQFRLLTGTPHPLEQVNAQMLAGEIQKILGRQS
ncbi:MAG: alpha/beta hydrolase [Chitinophagaceae bacterium]|jgi:pimeloyl-ACP methyl ester carboxylesterase|nr:alpha/beta hydrolase [Chitinophagaceae bacterium]